MAGDLLVGRTHERQRAQHRQGLAHAWVADGRSRCHPGDSRAEWVQCDLGSWPQRITVPVYPSSLPEQVAYILHNAEVTLACVDTPAQLEKLLQVRAALPALRHIVLMDGQPPLLIPSFSRSRS